MTREWSEANQNEAEHREDASSIYTEQKDRSEKHDINPEGYHLYVDLDLMLMYVYKDGELVKTYEVSGGSASTPSPVGTWKIISKDTWGEGFGGAWLGFNVPWGLYGIHGTNEPWSVGKHNTSKGCIRMRNNEVKELYNMVPYNATVTIVYENMPFYPMRDGDVGFDVLKVERALKKLGYYHGSLDGIFGSALKKAVMKFQEDHKLYKTGVVNNSTYEKIMEEVKELEAGKIDY
ncbi:MAG: L,D-transpeptidase family protein [Acetivibrionales bacterium]